MVDLISIGNIGMDMYFKGDSLTTEGNRFSLAIGGKYFVDRFHQGIGGGGANVAIGASHQGRRTAVMGKIGNNVFKRIILSDLADYGVNHSLCTFEDDYLNVSSILLAPNGERSIINFDTPHQHLIHEGDLHKLLATKMVYMGNLPDVSFADREQITRFLRKHDIPVALNLGVKDCRRPIEQIENFLKPISIIMLNSHEFAELIKKNHRTLDLTSPRAYSHPMLDGKIIIITDGEKGSYGYTEGEVVYQEAIPVHEVVDTTGAGDGYVAAFLAEFIESENIMKAMNKGAHYARKILQKLGAN